MKKLFFLSIILSLCLNIGCSAKILSYRQPLISITDKNYILNQKQETYVGKPILRAKQYIGKRFKTMKATEDFTITAGMGGGGSTQGIKGEDFDMLGETVIDGKTFFILRLPKSDIGSVWLRALVDKEGFVKKDRLLNSTIFYSAEVQPENLRFVPSKNRDEKVRGGGLNYEVLFSGIDGDSIKLNYREYTKDDMARPAFSQTLTYNKNSEYIRFKDTKIKIHEVNNEKMVYTVVEDAY